MMCFEARSTVSKSFTCPFSTCSDKDGMVKQSEWRNAGRMFDGVFIRQDHVGWSPRYRGNNEAIIDIRVQRPTKFRCPIDPIHYCYGANSWIETREESFKNAPHRLAPLGMYLKSFS